MQPTTQSRPQGFAASDVLSCLHEPVQPGGLEMTTEQDVSAHYATGGVLDRVRAGLAAAGVDLQSATVKDLKPADEFHTGGVAATDHLFDQIDLPEGAAVLDVGSGIGGTSRYLAERYGARVTGIDLTPEFVETAQALSAMVGMDAATRFVVGSALDMPVPDGAFDLAVLMHVGMNIADKGALLAEIGRALAPGGRLALFEVMRGAADGPFVYPVPWATGPETSFLASPETYRARAEAAGLTLEVETDRSDFALEFFAGMAARLAAEGPPPLGIHLLMGASAPEKLGNYVTNLKDGRLKPVEMIFTKGS